MATAATNSFVAQSQGNPWDVGMPTAPGFTPIYNPNTMSMLPGYEQYMQNNDQGYNAFRGQALRTGPSNWANLATVQQGQQAADQTNKAIAQGGANEATADSQLAMQGGLASGARERAAESGANATTGAEQGIARQEGQNVLQIGMNDEQNRMSELGQLPGMEDQRAQQWQNVKQNDLSNSMNENQAVNSYNQNLYQQQLTAWGAAQQANATANSGKK